MSELETYRDSTRLLGDGDSLRRRLSSDGYLFFRGLLPRDAALEVRDELLRVLEVSGWLEDGTDPSERRPGPRVVNEGDEHFFEAYEGIQRLERFHTLAHHEGIRRLVGSIVEGDLAVHPQKVARINFPDNPYGTTPAHQDYRYIQGTTDVFTTWIPLVPCPVDQGGLKILRGSHERGLIDVRPVDRALKIECLVEEDDPDWAGADYEPGDVLLFHSLTVHGGLPNESGRVRLSADYRYQSASDPLVVHSLHPHWWPKIPDWPELVVGWSSLDGIEAPDDPTIAEFVRSVDLPPLGPSRLFEFPR